MAPGRNPAAGRTNRETCTGYPEPRSSWRHRRGGRRDGPRPAGDLTTSTSAPASRRDGPGGRSGRGCPAGFFGSPSITRAARWDTCPAPTGSRLRPTVCTSTTARGRHRRRKGGQIPIDGVITINTRNVQNGAHRLVVMTHARQIRPNEGVLARNQHRVLSVPFLCSKLVHRRRKLQRARGSQESSGRVTSIYPAFQSSKAFEST
jgi:hypothetical protein